MIKIIKNEIIDMQLMPYMDKEDSLKLLTSSPILAFLTLNNINNTEKKAFTGVMEIAYVLVEFVPFLIFRFENGLSFDSAIFNMEALDKTENALYLHLIENTDYKVVGSRFVGLDQNIIKRLLDDTKNMPYSNDEFLKKGKEIQEKYETNELFEMSFLKQSFLGL